MSGKMSSEWEQWVTHNLSRGCNPYQMLEQMLASGINRQHASQALNLDIEANSVAVNYSYSKIPPKLTEPLVRVLGDERAKLYVIENFLTPQECQEIIEKSKGKFRPSEITISDEPDQYFRTSQTHDFNKKDPFYRMIDQKFSTLIDLPPQFAEETQVQYYQPTNEFKAHTDYFTPDTKEWNTFAGDRGQRTWTVTTYLNDVSEGGHTDFLNLGISVQPRQGMALAWNNLDQQGKGNPDTLHQGSKVKKGEKYILTKWFRDRVQYKN